LSKRLNVKELEIAKIFLGTLDSHFVLTIARPGPIVRGFELDCVEEETYVKCFGGYLNGISQSLTRKLFLY
jgi:hypothetical protein